MSKAGPQRSTPPSPRTDTAWQTHACTIGDDPLPFLAREWVLTNGTGAYAMGTAMGVNTRRYHGLLIAAQRPPVGRILALNQVLEQLTLATSGGKAAGPVTLEFSAAMFRDPHGRDVFAPKGHTLLERFERGLTVAWHYRADNLTFSRELILHWKEQAATVRYTIGGLADRARLRLAPMMTVRDFHALLHKDSTSPFQLAAQSKRITVRHDDAAVTVACDRGQFVEEPQWWYRQHYAIDTERGQEDTEDQFLPGAFVIDLEPKAEQVITLTVALGDAPAAPRSAMDDRAAHLSPLVNAIGAMQPQQVIGRGEDATLARVLAIAADDFVVDRTIGREKLSTILAGYPWFADWGRDTFIALPGLLLVTGRHEEARATLQTFAQAIRNGLVPNRFDDYSDAVGAAHYNTVDASLWFINAAMQYIDATGDIDAWNDWLREACCKIINAYIKGTDYSIRMAGDGLIAAGNLDTQLTWMDAACGGRVFTPRAGKAVEVNALWYDVLTGMAERLHESHPREANHYQKLAKRISRSFVKVFWDEELKHLRDHIWVDEQGVEHADRSLRPNQVFVASLTRSPLPRTKQKLVLQSVKKRLLTPFGLRTLPDDHPAYHAHYTGPQMQRDEAYHQGTVWPWLIGPYAEAVLRVGQFSPEAKKEAGAAIAPLLEQMLGEGEFPTFGQLYEVHEAAPPHRPGGCMAQAWSVAEVLRVLKLLTQG